MVAAPSQGPGRRHLAWIYPFALGISVALPTILAGNAVFTKPDS